MGRKTVQGGTGRQARSLKDDPRGAHRNSQGSQNAAALYGRTLRVNRLGQVDVNPGRPVIPAPEFGPQEEIDSSAETAAVKNLLVAHDALVASHRELLKAHNKLLTSLRDARLLEGGR